jgi:hypothetical protein
VADWLRLSFGRFHTSIGYFNDTYHYGAFYVVPVDRPTAVQAGDYGGIVPIQTIGVHADGRFFLSEWVTLRYDALLTSIPTAPAPR